MGEFLTICSWRTFLYSPQNRPKGKKIKREKSRTLGLRIKSKRQKKDKDKEKEKEKEKKEKEKEKEKKEKDKEKDKDKDKKKKKKAESLSPQQPASQYPVKSYCCFWILQLENSGGISHVPPPLPRKKGPLHYSDCIWGQS